MHNLGQDQVLPYISNEIIMVFDLKYMSAIIISQFDYGLCIITTAIIGAIVISCAILIFRPFIFQKLRFDTMYPLFLWLFIYAIKLQDKNIKRYRPEYPIKLNYFMHILVRTYINLSCLSTYFIVASIVLYIICFTFTLYPPRMWT